MLFSKPFAGLALAALVHDALGQVIVTVTTTKQVTTTASVCPSSATPIATPLPTPLASTISQDGTCGGAAAYTCQGSSFGVGLNIA